MKHVLSALLAAFKSLFHPGMLTLVLWPMLVSAVLWTAAALFFWGSWKAALTSLFHVILPAQWLDGGYSAAVSGFMVALILVLLLLSMIYLTALVITAIFAMPLMVEHVAQRYYPALERKDGAGAAGGVVNTLLAIFLYCIGMAISLPLWLFFPLSIVLPVLLSAWLNQRLFRYDALAEHANKDEIAQVARRSRGRLFMLGMAAGLLQFVPVLNLLLPVYMGLAFSHLCLGELTRLRQAA